MAREREPLSYVAHLPKSGVLLTEMVESIERAELNAAQILEQADRDATERLDWATKERRKPRSVVGNLYTPEQIAAAKEQARAAEAATEDAESDEVRA